MLDRLLGLVGVGGCRRRPSDGLGPRRRDIDERRRVERQVRGSLRLQGGEVGCGGLGVDLELRASGGGGGRGTWSR